MTKAEMWPGYETVGPIGRGTYGSVYEIKKTDPSGEYISAVKRISVPASKDEYYFMLEEGWEESEIRSYFESRLNTIVNEYQLMEKFKGNSNIVSYEDHMVMEHEDGIGWDILIKMELLVSLPKYIKENGTLSPQQAIRLGKDICSALSLIQTENMVHRDIKPQNILVNRFGAFKLGDFGIAKQLERSSSASVAGTPDYIAPEVYRGEGYSELADQYSLGLVLYWALNNRKLPFYPEKGKITPELIEAAKSRRLSGEAMPAPAHGNDALAQVILKACAYDPAERYADIRAFRNALKQCERFEELSPEVIPENENAGTAEEIQKKEKTKVSTSTDVVISDVIEEVEEDEEDFESGKTIGFAGLYNVPGKNKGETVKNESAEKDNGTEKGQKTAVRKNTEITEILEKYLPAIAAAGGKYHLEYAIRPPGNARIVKDAGKIAPWSDSLQVLGVLAAYDDAHSLKHVFVFTDQCLLTGSDPACFEIMKLKRVEYAQLESITYYGISNQRLRIRRTNVDKTAILYLNESLSASRAEQTVCDPAQMKKLLENLIGIGCPEDTVSDQEPDTGKQKEKLNNYGENESIGNILILCDKSIAAEQKLRYAEADKYNLEALNLACNDRYAIGLAYAVGALLTVADGNPSKAPQYNKKYRTLTIYKRGSTGSSVTKLGFPKNHKRAVQWLERAGEEDKDPRAYIVCALLYEFEKPIRNLLAAEQYVQKAIISDARRRTHDKYYAETLERIRLKKDGNGRQIAEILAQYEPYLEKKKSVRGTKTATYSDDDYRVHNIYVGTCVNEGLMKALNKRRSAMGERIATEVGNHISTEKVLCVYQSGKQAFSWIFTDKTIYLHPFWWQKKSIITSMNNTIEKLKTNIPCLWIDISVIDQVIMKDQKTVMITFNQEQAGFKNFAFLSLSFFDMKMVFEALTKIIGTYQETADTSSFVGMLAELEKF